MAAAVKRIDKSKIMTQEKSLFKYFSSSFMPCRLSFVLSFRIHLTSSPYPQEIYGLF